MTLSILWLGNLNYGLFDGDRCLLTGTILEMEDWKNRIERKEQQAANREHFAQLRERYTQQLVAGGNSAEQATKFLKDRMPFLW